MEIQGYFTNKGLALSAKLLTGDTLRITRVAAGSGETQDPMQATSLPQSKQELAVNTPTRSGNTVTVPATLAAASADEDYILRELGVYAQDPNEGEILYKLYRLDEPVDITAGSRLVLRFYLEETVSQDLSVTVDCAPAGLVTETEFRPVYEAFYQKAAVSRNVSIDASDLPAFIEALPRRLMEHITVFPTGTLTEPLMIRDFWGPGSLTIYAKNLGDCTINAPVSVKYCGTFVEFVRIVFEKPAETSVAVDKLLFVSTCAYVRASMCTFRGTADGTVSGVTADYGSTVTLESCQFSGLSTVALAQRNAQIAVHGNEAADFHDNGTGAYVWRGGTFLLSGSAPNTLGGSRNTKDGGIIVQKDGTLL